MKRQGAGRGAIGAISMLAFGFLPFGALAQGLEARKMPGLSSYGVPGHIDMPSAFSLPDGNFAFTFNQFGPEIRRGTTAFQITPRLLGVFRYSYLGTYFDGTSSLYDRSFDLRYQISRENLAGWRPAVAVGLQDFGGTGIFSGEYLVASKHFGPKVTASAGIGWGRFGSYGSFRNPLSFLSDGFDNRGGFAGNINDTGSVRFDSFFRGDAALFLGMDWQASDQLKFSVEYSSDAMRQEISRMGYQHKTPINIGAEYTFRNQDTLALSLMHGAEVALSYSISLDPARPINPSGAEPAGPAISAGRAGPIPDREEIRKALADQGIALAGFEVEGNTATAAISNRRWGRTAQAWGRSVRVLSQSLPPEVENFRLHSMERGIAVRDVTFSRADLAELEFAPDGAWQTWARAELVDPGVMPDPRVDMTSSRSLTFSPYLENSFFDPDDPLRADTGVQMTGEWSPTPGIYFSSAIRQKVIGTMDQSTRRSTSVLPRVRSNSALYSKVDGPRLAYATAEWFARPGSDLYSRVTAGVLERMFAGVSGELLWAPVDQRYALGIELNRVRQRDYEGGLGFFDYEVSTGHASLYYDFGEGYLGQLDAGRYLAGDWGGTVTMTRRFGNGFEVGAFFSLTDVGFEAFGEGSFDKGIFITVPLSYITGRATRQQATQTIRPILRDGGARLSVRSRLYDLTQPNREASSGEGWGRFWR